MTVDIIEDSRSLFFEREREREIEIITLFVAQTVGGDPEELWS
jgi:hypothetical protein